MDFFYFRNVKPEDYELMKTLFDKLILTTFKTSVKQKTRGTFSERFLSKKEEIKKDNTILCYENCKKIYFVDKLPDYPGTYFFFDKSENLLYVGSTKKLSQRVPQSFVERNGKEIVQKIAYRISNTVEEARDLESIAINKYKPKFNVIVPQIPGANLNIDELKYYASEVEVWSEEQ